MINTYKTTRNKSFDYKTKIIDRKLANISRLGTKFVVPLKYFNYV